MAFVLKDRVKEITTTTGTGDVSLGGSSATFDQFQSYLTNGDTTYYAIAHTATGVDEWEVGLGTWNTGNTLSRTTVLAGSNGTSAVNFSTGTKDIFMSYPASKAIYKDADGKVDITPTAIDDTVIGGTTAAAGSFTDIDTSGEIDVGTHIDFTIQSAHASYAEGRLWYDNIHKTLNFYSDNQNVIHEIGLEEHQRVFNNSGSTIGKGKPLYFAGNYTAGSIDVPTVGLADATDVNAYNAQGLAAADIPNNSYGYCIIAGQLDGLDTSGLTAGTNFFVGLTPGAVQNASPTYPNYPMCLGWVVNSDATDGVLLVNQQNHSVRSFRVQTDAHIGSDLIVGGNLSVLGTTTTTSTSDVTAGAPFYRANEGDAIGESGTTFTGSGLDDAFFSGHFTGTTATTYYVKIDGTGTPDTFSVSTDNFATTISTGTAITGSEQLIHSADNIYVKFGATTGHTLNDVWTGTASPILVDTGFFSNRNTGTSGVGYTHMGFFYDVSTDKWTLLDEYDPTPAGSINLSDSSVSYGTLKLDSVEGSVTGNVTGDVSGNATTATTLATARNIGGVSFDGSADISLPGVNSTGSQDTTGNAATATALETARTIQLSGDVTGSVSFDGTGNVNITSTVVDDSHAHVISNVDGLQTALDGKVATSFVVAAGNGLTGGGNLTANRTLAVGAGNYINVNADDIEVDATSANTASKVVARDASGNFSAGTITATLAGSADQVDGLEASQFLRSDADDSTSHNIEINGGSLRVGGTSYAMAMSTNGNQSTSSVGHTASNPEGIFWHTSNNYSIARTAGAWTAPTYQRLQIDWPTGIIISTQAAGTYTNSHTEFQSTIKSNIVQDEKIVLSGSNDPYIRFQEGTTNKAYIQWRSDFGDLFLRNQEDGSGVRIRDDIEFTPDGTNYYNIWHAGNDGSGSSLDADLLDGVQGTNYARTNVSEVTFDGGTNTTITVKGDDNGRALLRLNGDSQGTGAVEVGQSNTYGGGMSYNGDNSPAWASGETADNITFYRLENGTRTEVFHYPYNSNTVNFNSTPTVSGSSVWHAGNDGSGSGLDADTVDGIQGGSFIRSDADDNVSAHTEWQDNYEIRLGNDADFRIDHNSNNHTYFRSYNHAGGNIYFQGEDTSGTNHALLYMFTNNAAPYVSIYHDGNERFRTESAGVSVDGLYVGGNGANPHNANGIQVSGTNNEKIVLSGSASPYIRWQENTTDKAYIQWNSGGWLDFRNQENGNFKFQPTIDGQVPTIYLVRNDTSTASGNHLGELAFGHTDGSYDPPYSNNSGYASARIVAEATETTGSGDDGSRFDFWVKPTNTNKNTLSSMRFRMDQNGTFHADGNITAYSSTTSSDERLKKDIQKIDGALDKVKELSGYTFKFKKNDIASGGVIAQEVEKVFPVAVEDTESEALYKKGEVFKTVNYNALHGLLIEAIKEQQAQIDDLKEQLEKCKC